MIRAIVSRIAQRPPDFTIGEPHRPYMLRWWLVPRNRWFNVYLHCILRSDDERALHDHPWANCSIVLAGWYTEVFGDRIERRRRGAVVFRKATTPHRLVVLSPCWTLFLTGPKVREWGFWCGDEWRHWEVYTDGEDGSRVGRGCG